LEDGQQSAPPTPPPPQDVFVNSVQHKKLQKKWKTESEIYYGLNLIKEEQKKAMDQL
jgi:hypothetical protein